MKYTLLLALALLLHHVAPAQAPYWQKVSSPSAADWLSVSFGNSRVGYVAGRNGALARTLDGGLSWNTLVPSGITLNAASPDITHVNFVNPATGFAISGNATNPIYQGTVYKTTDSGRNWTRLDVGNIAATGSFFFDAQNGFVIGSAFFSGFNVAKQSAGVWGSWQYFSLNPRQFLYGIDFRNSRTGIVGGHDGFVHRTFDGGTSWDTVKTVTDSTINSLKFLSDGTIIAGADAGGALMISEDTGHTWDFDSRTITFSYPALKSVAASPRDSFIAVGHAASGPAGLILWNESGSIYNQTTTEALNAVAMCDRDVACIVGQNGAIYTNRQAVLGLGNQGRTLNHLLYPNPATGVFFSESTLPHKIRVFDALGRTVLERPLRQLRHIVALDAFAAGVYFVEAADALGTSSVQRLTIL